MGSLYYYIVSIAEVTNWFCFSPCDDEVCYLLYYVLLASNNSDLVSGQLLPILLLSHHHGEFFRAPGETTNGPSFIPISPMHITTPPSTNEKH